MAAIQEYIEIFYNRHVGIHALAMSARLSLTRGIDELLRLLGPGLSDLVRTLQLLLSDGLIQLAASTST